MEPCDKDPKNKKPCGKGYHLLGDDRMATMAYFAVPRPRDIWVADFPRIAFADGPDDWPMPYAPDFLANFDQQYCYDRFWAMREQEKYFMMTTRYMCSGWAWSAVGESGPSFFVKYGLSYFRNLYFQMGLLVYSQHATLLVFSDGLEQAVKHAKNDPVKYRQAIDREATNFSIFTDRYWLYEATNQVQGQELYHFWVEKLRLRELYRQVRDQIHDVHEILESQAEAELSERAGQLTKAGIPIGILSVLVGFWGSNFFEKRDSYWWMVISVSVGVAIVGGVLIFVFWLRSHRRRSR
jgi:hypothetical protein